MPFHQPLLRVPPPRHSQRPSIIGMFCNPKAIGQVVIGMGMNHLGITERAVTRKHEGNTYPLWIVQPYVPLTLGRPTYQSAQCVFCTKCRFYSASPFFQGRCKTCTIRTLRLQQCKHDFHQSRRRTFNQPCRFWLQLSWEWLGLLQVCRFLLSFIQSNH